MKKGVLAVCTLATVLACGLLTPVTARAEERGCNCNHSMTTLIDGTWVTNYSHQYLIENGANGPVYGSCHVHNVNSCQYVQCLICGYVDYNHRYNVQLISSTHDSCPLSVN
ncbi:MAG: hypothetical protein K5678_12005 [Acetatifactor sp.]|nr:hypothetical protein [Acetatifactor sp.]